MTEYTIYVLGAVVSASFLSITLIQAVMSCSLSWILGSDNVGRWKEARYVMMLVEITKGKSIE